MNKIIISILVMLLLMIPISLAITRDENACYSADTDGTDDSTNGGNDLTLSGGISHNAGHVDNEFSFDGGAGDRYEADNVVIPLGNKTIAFWADATNTGNSECLFNTGSCGANTGGTRCETNGAGQLVCVINNEASGAYFGAFENALWATETGYHLVILWVDDTAGQAYLIVDNVINISWTGSTGTEAIGPNNLRLGARHSDDGAVWNDGVDEFFVFNRSLTLGSCTSAGETCGGEVAEIYNSGTGLSCIVADTTVPTVVTSLNISLTNIKRFDVLNLSANVTDDIGLSFCQIIHNQSGNFVFINVSVSGTSDKCSSNIDITAKRGEVVNFTIRVNDTNNNFAMNDTIITIANTLPSFQRFTTVVLQDNDTEVIADVRVSAQSGEEDTNFGAQESLRVMYRQERRLRSYLMFELSNITNGVSVDNASLFLFLNSSIDWSALVGDREIEVNHVINYTWLELNVTHNSQMCNTSAVIVGGNCNATKESNILVEQTPRLGFYNWSVVSAVKREIANVSNNNISFIIHDSLENYAGSENPTIFFHSKEFTTNTSHRPFLEINYESVLITPKLPGTNNRLNGSTRGGFNDIDDDTESGSTFKWYKNDVVISGEVNQSLESLNFAVGDVLIFEAKPNDGFDTGSPVNSSSVTIANLLPSAPTIIVPTPDDYNNTQPDYPFRVTFAGDPDGDALTISYYINGVLNQTSPNNVTFNASDGTFILNVSLSDGTDSTQNSTVNFTIDTTVPTLLTFNLTNNTVFGFNVNVTFDITIQDTNPFNLSYTFFNASDDAIFTAFNDKPNTSTTISIVDLFNLTGLASGNYSLVINFSDRHTAVKIDNYLTYKDIAEAKLTFDTAENNDVIDLKLKSSDIPLDDFGTFKQFDRYIFWYDFSQTTPKNGTLHTYTFKLNNKEELKHLGSGHFITDRNWITFDLQNGVATYNVKETKNNKYELKITTAQTYLLFNSLGGLNVVDVFYNFQVDNDPPFFGTGTINNTLPSSNDVVALSQVCNDLVGLSTCFLAHNNSGSFKNVTNITLAVDTSTSFNQTFNLTVTGSQGRTIGLQACANDTFNEFACSGFATLQINDDTVPKINGTLNNTLFYTNNSINITMNVSDNFDLRSGQIIITEDDEVRFFNFTFSGTFAYFGQNFTIKTAAGNQINVTGIVNDSFGNQARNETLFTVTKDLVVSVVNVYDNTTVNQYNVTLFNSTFTSKIETTNGTVTFNNIVSGLYDINISSEDGNGYLNKTILNYNVSLNFKGEIHQAVVFLRGTQRGSNRNVTVFNVSLPKLTNFSNSTGELRLLLNASNFNVSGKADAYFDVVTELTLKNKSVSSALVEFYDINVSISIFSVINNTFLKNFTIFLTGVNTTFSENLTDNNEGNVTYSLTNNTYDITIEAPNHAVKVASFAVKNNDTYPNLTFSLLGLNSVNFSIFDEITEEFILGNDTTISLISDDFVVNDTAAENGRLYFQDLIEGDYRIEYNHPKYTKRDFYISVLNGTNQSVDLYLLSTGNGTAVTFTVQDNTGNKIFNATIRLKRYYVSSNSYRTVAMSRTNEEGKSELDVDFNDAFYETLTTFKEFSLRTLGAKIISTTRILTLELFADAFSKIDGINDITTSLTFNNASQTFSYVFTNNKGMSTTGIVEVAFTTPDSNTIVCTSTDTSASATLLCQVNTTNATGTYTARGYVVVGNKNVLTRTVSVITGITNKLKNIVGKQGFFFAILISGTLAGLGSLVSPAVAVMMFLVGIFISNFLGFSIIAASGLGFLIIIVMIMVWRMRK